MRLKNRLKVMGIDPGLTGAFCVFDGFNFLRIYDMPVETDGKRKAVHFLKVCEILNSVEKECGKIKVYLERAKPLAMGSGYAFNYGRDFQTLVIALTGWQTHLVEPSTWAKEMHQGVDKNLKPKAKSQIVVRKLFSSFIVNQIPKRPKAGDFKEGPMDALLIADYGLRLNNWGDVLDFY